MKKKLTGILMSPEEITGIACTITSNECPVVGLELRMDHPAIGERGLLSESKDVAFPMFGWYLFFTDLPEEGFKAYAFPKIWFRDIREWQEGIDD